MQIDSMSVAIRPMSTAQAVDLGFAMARHWFVPLWQIWMGMALPVFILMYVGLILFSGFKVADDSSSMAWLSYGSIGSLIFWWLKPVYETPLVNWLGQALFNDRLEDMPSSTHFIKQGWKSVRSNAGKRLFRYRLSTQRQLILPVLQLEQADSQSLKSRLQLLRRGQSSGVTWHTLIMVHIELAISIGIALLLYALLPKELIDGNTLFGQIDASPQLFELLWAVIYFITISVVAPFFICGGFAVYLTKRCLLEGWDVELAFKQLKKRYIDTQNNPITRLKKPLPTSSQSSLTSANRSSHLSYSSDFNTDKQDSQLHSHSQSQTQNKIQEKMQGRER